MENLNKKIDHTNINPNATKEDIIKSCDEVKQYQLRGLCVRPQWVSLAKQQLQGTDAKVICLVDPPIGDSSHEERIAICQKAKENGADEIDVVVNIPDVKHERWDKILVDLKEICQILPTKVIIGSGYLTDEEILKVSQIVKEAGAICVKTATEKDPLEEREIEEKARHLKLMRQGAPGLLIKASGNIKNFQEALYMIENGADIIGTSSGPKIIEESRQIQ
jgi:deoxyribose-phosphate aldolase